MPKGGCSIRNLFCSVFPDSTMCACRARAAPSIARVSHAKARRCRLSCGQTRSMQVEARRRAIVEADHQVAVPRNFIVRHCPGWCANGVAAQIGHTRRMVRRILLLPALIGLAHVQGGFAADNFPTKPVRIVVGFTPGTTTDITARALAQALTARLSQQVIVENREGANSGI